MKGDITMKKLIMVLMLTCASQLILANSFPCFDLTNKTANILEITENADWDDQVVIVNGKKEENFSRNLNPNDSINICGTWREFGLYFYYKSSGAATKFIAVTVSNLNGLTELDEIYPEGSLQYQVLVKTDKLLKINLTQVLSKFND